MSIEGIQDGWELVRFDYAANGEQYLNSCGDVTNHTSAKSSGIKRLIIRKIEKPKRYRPFANADEAVPFWDVVLTKRQSKGSRFRVNGTGALGVVIGQLSYSYQEAFDSFECIDGTPFGVEVTE